MHSLSLLKEFRLKTTKNDHSPLHSSISASPTVFGVLSNAKNLRRRRDLFSLGGIWFPYTWSGKIVNFPLFVVFFLVNLFGR